MPPSNPTRSPQTGPDIMNDPSYDTNTKSKQKGLEEPDTCRICRGEGLAEEPLFYPCKCSGSIKFVHQGCLMEWLSHSQKKHCELCKTSFRFTKLYHPQMPSTVPTAIFLRQAAVHVVKTVLIWARWHLVLFVWLGWVPWCMRTVWRGLFWIADGGWINWRDLEKQSSIIAQAQLDKLITAEASTANESLIIHKNVTAFEILSRVSNVLPPYWLPVSQTSNSTRGPSVLGFAKRLFNVMFHQHSSGAANLSSSVPPNATTTGLTGRSPSALSDINFLRTLTPWIKLNELLIDVLEGQLIALLVVIAFILIFLIREWVVQQQPAIDMGEAFNPPAAAPDRHEPEAAPVLLQPGEDVEQRQELPAQAANADERRFAVPRRPNGVGPRFGARRPARGQIFAQPDQQQQEPNLQQVRNSPNRDSVSSGDQPQEAVEFSKSTTTDRPRSLSDAGPSTASQRPGLPDSHSLSHVTEIQRTLQEHTGWPGINVFMDLWKRAESKPSKVLEIIQAEGREDELEWIVLAMKRLEHASKEREPIDENRQNADLATQLHHSLSGEQYNDVSNETWQALESPPKSGEEAILALQSKIQREGPQSTSVDDDLVTSDTQASQVQSKNGTIENNELAVQYFSTKEQGHSQSEPSPPSTSSKSPAGQEIEVEPLTPVQSISPKSPGVLTTQGPIPEGPSDASDQALTTPPGQDEGNLFTNFGPQFGLQVEPQTAMNGAHGFRENVANWLWGDAAQAGNRVADVGQDDAYVVRDLDEEAPFVPVAQGQLMVQDENVAEDIVPNPDIVQAAAEAGIDLNEAEAVEDGEDLEGIMELIGMQGPLAGLVQNGMFSAVLISMTVFCGIWIPYIAGKVALVFLANPISLLVKLPLRWASTAADLIIDSCVFMAACLFFWIDTALRIATTPIGWLFPFVATVNKSEHLSTTAWSYGKSAGERLAQMYSTTTDSFSDSDIPVFSIIAHESLNKAEHRLMNWMGRLAGLAKLMFHVETKGGDLQHEQSETLKDAVFLSFKNTFTALTTGLHQAWDSLPSLLTINPLRISLEIPQRTEPVDYSLASWGTRDRVITIVLGYLTFAVVGALYLRIKALLRDNQDQKKAEGAVADVLHQAAGVLKVILIISIEMIVFPLYCGLLLDAALLPLFEHATIASRMTFTIKSPVTSLFVHWFVGTCYMFHFALFVSMCRDIMRNGVLYFIRDPDDPTFHPVRDVLERSVSTQLRKIAFSALVYGALVIICLGSVVWGLTFALTGVFPIHWSSNEPVLEFPVDLLVYNFLMPLAVRFFKPSQGLNSMYDWWFRKCARLLRLSHFLFEDQRDDEEGRSVQWNPWNLFLGEQADRKESGRRQGDVHPPENHATDVSFRKDGRYVRTPASDQVRIPKGSHTFVEIDEEGRRADGQPETADGLHGIDNEMFTNVYIPPNFRLRICAFILLIWLFAATTGVAITIIPLICGRHVFAYLIPSHLRMNDIYAFSIGIYFLGGPLYLLVQYHTNLTAIYRILFDNPKMSVVTPSTVLLIVRRSLRYALRAVRLIYFYGAFFIILPSLFALLMESYLVIPLHTYFSSPSPSPPRHTIHFIQDWTLGVLYLKMAARIVLWRDNTRPAIALRAIVAGPRHGWFNPDIRLATRGVIFPATVVMVAALTVPLGFGWLANHTIMRSHRDELSTVVYRYAYPAVAGLACALGLSVQLVNAVGLWRGRIKDEVYLIGERLHNFGEKKVTGPGVRVVMGG